MVATAGCLVALHLKRNKPQLYAGLGRAIGDDTTTDPTGEAQVTPAETFKRR